MNDRTIKKSHKSSVCQLLMLKNKTKEIKDRKIFLFFVFSGCFPLNCQSQRKGSKTETKTKREKRRSNIFLRSDDIFYSPLISLSLSPQQLQHSRQKMSFPISSMKTTCTESKTKQQNFYS